MESRKRRAQRVYVATGVLVIGMLAMAAAGHDRLQSQTSDGETAAANWVKFSPEGAGFSLLLPEMPTETIKDEDAGLLIHFYKLRMGDIEYQVVWFAQVPDGMIQRRPLSVLFPRGLEEILKSARQAGKKEMITAHQDDITLDGSVGRESTIESATDQIDAEGFLARHDFITVAVLHPKQQQASADAVRFLKSLSLSGRNVASAAQGNLLPGANTGPVPSSQDEGDRRPIPLNPPRPEYTDQARNNKVQGVIRLRVLVGANGLVKDVRVASHLPDGLDEMAVLAAYGMRFRPALKSGQPVNFWQSVEVEFILGQK